MIVTTPPAEPAKPEPLSETSSTALSADDKAWLVEEATRKGMTQSAYLRRLVKIQRSLQVTHPQSKENRHGR